VGVGSWDRVLPHISWETAVEEATT